MDFSEITPSKKLTQIVASGGCAAKFNPTDLYKALYALPQQNHPNLLVGIGDDAGVYKISEDFALVFSTDIIAPLVDDPYDFGRVAAAHSLSDIYAMGGEPLMALNVLFLDRKMGFQNLEPLMRGSLDTCQKANTIIAGGHTVRNFELRYGLSVIGKINPKKIVTNSGGVPGDVLILTKPLGIGVLGQGLKLNKLPESVKQIYTETVVSLNDKAAAAMIEVGVHAATDITGFGLAGHLHELAKSSGCSATIYLENIPVLPMSERLVDRGIYSKNLMQNLEYVQCKITSKISDDPKMKLLFDPQTSGGLLMSLSADKVEALTIALKARGVASKIIGTLNDGAEGTLNIVDDFFNL